jgi:hypothetical protein
MSQKPAVGIALKAVIAILLVLLYFVIDIPAEIRVDENHAKSLSRKRMEVVAQAQKLYRTKNGKYTENYDLLLNAVISDTILNEKDSRVKLTKELLNKINKYNNVKASDAILNISRSREEILTILDEISDDYKTYEDIANLNEQTVAEINRFKLVDLFQNFNYVSRSLDSLDLLTINIEKYSLQSGAERAMMLSSVVIEYLATIELKNVSNIISKISGQLLELEKQMVSNSKPQNKTDRYKKFLERLQSNFSVLQSLNLQAESAELKKEQMDIVTTKDKYVNEYFTITSNRAILGLEEDEVLLIEMVKQGEKIFQAPPFAEGFEEYTSEIKKFKITLDDRGYSYEISCPNDTEGKLSKNVFFSLSYQNYGNIKNDVMSWE